MKGNTDASSPDGRDAQAMHPGDAPFRRVRETSRNRKRAEPDPGLRFHEADNSPASLQALARFYRERYVVEFPDPDERESLANMQRYLALKERGWYGPNNYHIVIAEIDGKAVGGAVFDYLAEVDAGVIEFLFVDAVHRRAGLGHALLDESIRILRADARGRRGRPLKALVAEMNDPYRRPATPDNMDPFRRAAVWGKWGFHALGFPYVQPALSAGQDAVDGLLLIARLFGRVPKTGVSAAWVERVVAEYLRWAMRIETPADNPDYGAMASFLRERRRIPFYPLQHYVGHDPQREFEIREIDGQGDRAAPAGGGQAFQAAIALARVAIPMPGRVAAPDQFASALAAARAGGPPYHLWALRAPGADVMDGMASFFTLHFAGFGGYLVLTGALRGRGLLPLVLARIEAQMMRDDTQAEGWFIECGEESARLFLHAGFAEVPLDYRPPPVGDQATQQQPERLHLLYKPFGMLRPACHLRGNFILHALEEILREVYGVAAPPRHDCYRLARDTLVATVDGVVVLRGAQGGKRYS
ncbi:GNAT family N-acetyltransferase [Aromatoleum diolicum]|uniref:GNAT family N-acetyltransferase n=1 Tax=Aromatoleum diolicum TaxID=75796 RepID=A0ABX1QFD9_9RHOO|nr:GNAT family N-acetyltransferase [Aromatoleum diolicum]NMG75899.1 GNAT family N-acetyltransferase [Aromatoleum diolicum]